MKHSKVGALMTADVVRAEYGTPFREVARRLTRHGISGLPVVDDDEKVVGVVSESDLLLRQADGPGASGAGAWFLPRRWAPGARTRRSRARARTAGPLMSRRHPRNLLQVFLRPRPGDPGRDQTRGAGPGAAAAARRRRRGRGRAPGVVPLSGQLERRVETTTAVEMCRRTDGVVAVVDHLTHRFDDHRSPRGEPALHGKPHYWQHRP